MTGGSSGAIATVIASGAAGDAAPIDWAEAGQLFAAERSYWVATTNDDGSPHVRPVLAVLVDERIYSTTSLAARKGRNLTSRATAALTARAPAMDIVIEGPIAWIDEPEQLRRIAAAYQDKYAWPVTVTVAGNGFDAPYGAPTAGPPPYRAYELVPAVAYAFGTGSNLGERSTRFRFPRMNGADG